MTQNDWDIVQTRKARKRKVGDLHTSLAQWHQGIGGHGYVKLGVAKGKRFNLYKALCRLSDSINQPAPTKAHKAGKAQAPASRIGIGGTLVHERRDASGILLPTARHRRYTPAPTVPAAPLKYAALGFDNQRMD